MLNIDGDEISITIDVDQGARLASVQWRDLEFCVPDRGSTINWGWYAMAPWAGRVRDGALKDKNGNYYALPTHFTPPHAIHGFGLTQAWNEIGKGWFRMELPQPYGSAVVEQQFEILGDAIRWTLEYESNGCELPFWMGMHPWFPTELARGGEVELNFHPQKMFKRDSDGLPTGELITPTRGPWDDCFTQVRGMPQLTWPGAATLTLDSDAPYWVVYNEEQEAIAVEPQTAPPDAANLGIKSDTSIELLITFEEDYSE